MFSLVLALLVGVEISCSVSLSVGCSTAGAGCVGASAAGCSVVGCAGAGAGSDTTTFGTPFVATSVAGWGSG